MDKKLKETAVVGSTSATSIGGFRDYLLSGATTVSKKKKKHPMIPVTTRYGFKLVHESRKPFVFSDFLTETENSEFDPTAVISKLKTASKNADAAKTNGTQAFALEDDQGRMVKVWIARDQAEEFESALQTALQGNDTDGDDDNTQKEIAEVLWELRNKFDIVNVEWRDDIPEDLEEIIEPGTEEDGDDLELDAEGGDDLEMDADDVPPEDDADVKSALSAVIDMMKADAEARKAEADARAREADAKISGAERQEAENRVKQEEELLDMESYYDDKKKEDDEAKRLKKLAQYKHDVATDNGPIRHPEEEEEYVLPKRSRFMRSKYRNKMDKDRSDYDDTRHRPKEKGVEYRKRMKIKKPTFMDVMRRGGY